MPRNFSELKSGGGGQFLCCPPTLKSGGGGTRPPVPTPIDARDHHACCTSLSLGFVEANCLNPGKIISETFPVIHTSLHKSV